MHRYMINKSMARLVILALVATLVGGCSSPAKKPAPNPAPGRPGGDTTGTAGAKTTVNNPGDEVVRVIKKDARYKNSKQMQAVVVGNIAVVGMGDPDTKTAPGPATPGLRNGTRRDNTNRTMPTPPPGTAARPGVPGTVTPPTSTTPPVTTPGTYNPRPGSVKRLERGLEEQVRQKVPEVVRVYITTDPVLIRRIDTVARDMRSRVPIDRRINEIAMIVDAVSGGRAASPSTPNVPGESRPGAP